MKVDIFKVATGEVIEVGKEIGSLRSWEFYWDMQASPEYGWRLSEEHDDALD